jgi:putative GTP pyrophosphokinase
MAACTPWAQTDLKPSRKAIGTVVDIRDDAATLSGVTTNGFSDAEFARFVLPYRMAIWALSTKIAGLREELTHRDASCAIEEISSRVKSLDRLMAKAQRLRCPLTPTGIRRTVLDIGGVRVICGVISDTYRVANLLSRQSDVTVTGVEDYIAEPKPNGYKSLHLAVEVSVELIDRVQQVPVELQIRTRAMDFWASFEHRLVYRNRRVITRRLADDLVAAADAAHLLDITMERLHRIEPVQLRS